MATTIKLKNGSGAPLAGDLVQGEPAFDLTNKRLYTEDSGGTVIEVGTNPTSLTTGTFTSTGIDDNATSTAVTIDASEQVGIGTTSPSTALHVYATSAGDLLTLDTASTPSSPNIVFKNANGEQARINSKNGGSLAIGTGSSGTEHILIDNSGNVGIGETSPARTLDVNAGTSNVVARFASTDFTAGLVLEDDNGTPDSVILNCEAGAFTIDVGGGDNGASATEAMRIDSSGNVGIGETSPSNTLHIKNTTSSGAYINYDGQANTEFGLRIESNASGGNFESDFANGTTALLDLYANSATTSGGDLLVARTQSATPVLLVKADGNVGIGTGSPDTLLELAGNNNSGAENNTLRFTDTSNATLTGQALGKIEFKTNDSSGDGPLVRAYVGAFATDATPSTYLSFATNLGGVGTVAEERLRINASGDVNISSGDLHVSELGSAFTLGPTLNNGSGDFGIKASTPQITLEPTADGQSSRIQFSNTSGTIWGSIFGFNDTEIMQFTADVFTFKSSSTERARIDSSGNLLVGTTATPTSSAGNIVLQNGTAPTASATDGVILYAEDVSSSSELKVRDEAGNITTLSPHNFDLIPQGPSEDMAWSYYSERDGKQINVDMLKAIRVLEKLSGEQLVFEN